MGLFSIFWLGASTGSALRLGSVASPSRSWRAEEPAFAVGFGAAAFTRFASAPTKTVFQTVILRKWFSIK
jgi:hypothetical protein